jgi:hypothetical protein
MYEENDRIKSLERAFMDPIIANTFSEYFLKWNEETEVQSSTQVMFENRYYKKIIKMGWDAVPHIINQLRIQPDYLFKALKEITGISMINPKNAGHLNDSSSPAHLHIAVDNINNEIGEVNINGPCPKNGESVKLYRTTRPKDFEKFRKNIAKWANIIKLQEKSKKVESNWEYAKWLWAEYDKLGIFK